MRSIVNTRPTWVRSWPAFNTKVRSTGACSQRDGEAQMSARPMPAKWSTPGTEKSGCSYSTNVQPDGLRVARPWHPCFELSRAHHRHGGGSYGDGPECMHHADKLRAFSPMPPRPATDSAFGMKQREISPKAHPLTPSVKTSARGPLSALSSLRSPLTVEVWPRGVERLI
jgi:hypothetical protein